MKTTWWLRIVGMFYLFLALGSVWVVFINPNIFGSIIPFAANRALPPRFFGCMVDLYA